MEKALNHFHKQDARLPPNIRLIGDFEDGYIYLALF